MRQLLCLLAIAMAPSAVLAQPARPNWNEPFPAHQVIDNVYFVGTVLLGSFLIATPAGHILINSDFESTVPVIRESVESLGFKFEDIAIILGSHAHGDHMQADALAKELTGARVMAMAEDVPALRRMRPGDKEHPIDRILEDGEQVVLGGTTLTAHLTAGHTKGCTSWALEVEENGQVYDALIVCSYGVNPGYVLVDNSDYPEIADDYVATFTKARELPVDVFLGSHGFWYGLAEKYAQLQNRGSGDPNPFVDRAGYLAHVDTQEQNFKQMLAGQKAGSR